MGRLILNAALIAFAGLLGASCPGSYDGPKLPREPLQRTGIKDWGLCREDSPRTVWSKEGALGFLVARNVEAQSTNAVQCIKQSDPEFNGQKCYSAEDEEMIKNFISALQGKCKEWEK